LQNLVEDQDHPIKEGFVEERLTIKGKGKKSLN